MPWSPIWSRILIGGGTKQLIEEGCWIGCIPRCLLPSVIPLGLLQLGLVQYFSGALAKIFHERAVVIAKGIFHVNIHLVVPVSRTKYTKCFFHQSWKLLVLAKWSQVGRKVLQIQEVFGISIQRLVATDIRQDDGIFAVQVVVVGTWQCHRVRVH